MTTPALAHLSGGPLDDQTIPLDDGAPDELVLPYSEGQLVYKLVTSTDDSEGPATAEYRFNEVSEILFEGKYDEH
ncbi:MAG: response regulator [Herbiconiux sp.]|uniref:response regulator n=1 Tax=Herbiconiux sp. TaxID=1871186 RepID=UPI0011F7231F|nr:response regulator [Herbiconiux sp.]TAJ49195.1 MAG: response regulator [Herbiconiux sp.]